MTQHELLYYLIMICNELNYLVDSDLNTYSDKEEYMKNYIHLEGVGFIDFDEIMGAYDDLYID